MDYTLYGSDKETEHQYFTEVYEELFAKRRASPVDFLELGLWGGGCLKMWRSFFDHDRTTVVGIDINPIHPAVPDNDAIFFYQQHQADEIGLTEISERHGPWDVIVDDASHRAHETMASLMILWRHLKPGGIYVIEDIFYAWPHAHHRQLDGDTEAGHAGDLLQVPMQVLKRLPEFGVRKYGIEYRRESGVFWMVKEWDSARIDSSGIPCHLGPPIVSREGRREDAPEVVRTAPPPSTEPPVAEPLPSTGSALRKAASPPCTAEGSCSSPNPRTS